MLEIKNLTKEFKSGDSKVIPVNNISFNIDKGTFASIVGKSGSGKTSLLSLLGALEKPSKGSIIVDGKDITKLSDHALIEYRRDKIGFIFQQYNLIPNLTALENVMLPMEFAKIGSKERKDRAEKLLNSVGISNDKQVRKPTKLSGGEQQRVSIARALSNNPSLILADEPTGNLDSNTSKSIISLLHQLVKDTQLTLIIVTHDLNITKYTDVTFQISDGKLITHNKSINTLLD